MFLSKIYVESKNVKDKTKEHFPKNKKFQIYSIFFLNVNVIMDYFILLNIILIWYMYFSRERKFKYKNQNFFIIQLF